MNIYEQMKKAGVPLDHHESDLFVKITPRSRQIVQDYEHKENVTVFPHQETKELWFDVPFAYQPFWDAKLLGEERS